MFEADVVGLSLTLHLLSLKRDTHTATIWLDNQTMPIIDPVLSDEEELVDLDALVLQLEATKAKNEKIAQKERDHKVVHLKEAQEQQKQKENTEVTRIANEAKEKWLRRLGRLRRPKRRR